MPSRREQNSDSSFFIFNRAKKQMLAAGGDGHGQSHEAAVALVPAAAPAPLPAPSGYHTGERPRNRDRWRVGQSPRSLATEPACQRQRYSWTLALPAARRVCEQTPHVPRSSKHDRARTRRWPHAQLQRPVRGPGSRKGAAHGRSTRRETRRPRCGRWAPSAPWMQPSPEPVRQRRRRSDRQSEPELWSEVLLL